MTQDKPMTVVYKADPARASAWAEAFRLKAPHHDLRLWPDIGEPRDVDCLVAWEPPRDLAATFPNLKVLFSVGAGADQFDLASLPPHLPLVRMVEPGIAEGMSEFVTMAVLALHRDLPDYLARQRRQIWEPLPVASARERRIGFLGAGMLAKASIARLAPFGFPIATWSRHRHETAGVESHAGPEDLQDFLARTDILVCLLPLTNETTGLLDARLFACLPKGAALVHVGRGAQLLAGDLLAALDCGHLGAAFVDVTEPEPVPRGHPFWNHPRIVMTPHIASATCPDTAAQAVLDNLHRLAAGKPLVGLVDREKGY